MYFSVLEGSKALEIGVVVVVAVAVARYVASIICKY